jgi:Bax protein
MLTGCGEKRKTLQILTIDLADSLQIIPITDSLVRPVLYHHIPDFTALSPEERKSNFIATVLPAILITKFRLGEKRSQVKQLSSQEEWADEDSSFYLTQQERFKSDDVRDLINRMKTHPNSIILAQAAVERSTGITGDQGWFTFHFSRRKSFNGSIGFVSAMSCMIYFKRCIVLSSIEGEGDFPEGRTEK